ncbi:Hsp20/alpha crystallin family protein [Candidatus Woesearchaeota archaeon]|nr:Hsp20/alpha crystallin family protein [Candidatus Woesearchaeota archaeon]MBI2107921.1 Hsp20/alpha crystallin family protein [Candidatus Woesearchaeota archaeon]
MIGRIFDEINRMERDMSMLCIDKCAEVVTKSNEPEVVLRLPVADLYETESSVIATFELPGVEKEEIQLDVTEDRIEVKVEKKAEKEINFYGALPMPKDVVAENAEATYKNGILRIEIPKAKKQDSRKRIEIR